MPVRYYLVGDDIPNFQPFMKAKDLESYYDNLGVFSPEYVILSNVTDAKKIYNHVVIARLYKIPLVFYYDIEPTEGKKHVATKTLRRIGIKFYYNFKKISSNLREYLVELNEKMVTYFTGNCFLENKEFLDQLISGKEKKTEKPKNSEPFIFRIKKCYNKTIFYGLLYSGSVEVGEKIYIQNEEMVVSSLHTSKREEKRILSGKQLCSIKVVDRPNIKKTRNLLLTSHLLEPNTTKKWKISVEITRHSSFHITKGYTGHALTKYCPLTFRVEEILSDKTVLYPGDRAHILITTEKNIYVEDHPTSELDRTLVLKDANILAVGVFID